MAKAALTRDDILLKVELAQERVNVPEWGGDVFVRELTASERDAYEGGMMIVEGTNKTVKFKPDLRDAKAKLAIKTVVDESGKRLFTDKDLAAVGATSSRALQRVVDVAERLSGMDRDSVEKKKADLSPSQDAASTSG